MKPIQAGSLEAAFCDEERKEHHQKECFIHKNESHRIGHRAIVNRCLKEREIEKPYIEHAKTNNG